MIQDLFQSVASYVALAVDATAVLMVGLAGLDAAYRSIQHAIRRSPMLEQRAIWLNFATWILLALEFSLGADVIGTAIAPTWDMIGKLGAIAVIRTFLGFFLGRDFKDVKAFGGGGARSDG
jgi:uncharacterized membrane protein